MSQQVPGDSDSELRWYVDSSKKALENENGRCPAGVQCPVGSCAEQCHRLRRKQHSTHPPTLGGQLHLVCR